MTPEPIDLNIYLEPCCPGSETCHNIIHSHFDCPVCGEENVGSDRYGDMSEDIQYSQENQEIECEECGARFRLVSWDKECPVLVGSWRWLHLT